MKNKNSNKELILIQSRAVPGRKKAIDSTLEAIAFIHAQNNTNTITDDTAVFESALNG